MLSNRLVGKFLLSAQLEAYLKMKGVLSLPELHLAFANKSRIRAMIQFNRLTAFPEGRQIGGIDFLYSQEKANPDTVCNTDPVM